MNSAGELGQTAIVSSSTASRDPVLVVAVDGKVVVSSTDVLH